MAKRLVVFTPGILGSSLVYDGPGKHGVRQVREIWGENGLLSAYWLLFGIQDLNSEYIRPRSILRHVSFGKRFDVYGRLLRFCTSKWGLGLQEGFDFYPFAYDWRSSLETSANQLAKFVAERDPEGEREVWFIAHSLGGLVVRMLLHRNRAIACRTNLLFQIATPVGGSQRAFRVLRDRMSFALPADLAFRVAYAFNPACLAGFRETCLSLASLYELLPHEREKSLLTQAGQLVSAFRTSFWPPVSLPLLRSAARSHMALQTPAACPVVSVYAAHLPTPIMHEIDSAGRILHPIERPVGDGTVTAASAFATTALSERYVVSGSRSEHVSLCSNKKVWKLLRERLQ